MNKKLSNHSNTGNICFCCCVKPKKKIFAKEAPGRAHEYVSSFEKLFLYNLYQWVIAYKRNRTWTMYFSCVWISQNHLPHSLKHGYWHKNRWFGPFLGLLVEEYVVCNMYVNMFLLIKFERTFCQIVLCVGGGKENTNGAQSVYSIPLTTMHLWCV